MTTPILLRQILPNYEELKDAGKIAVQRDGDSLTITAKRYAQDTGDEVEPLKLTPTKAGLEEHRAALEEELALVDRVLAEFAVKG